MEAGTTSAVEAAFKEFQIEVDADPELVRIARRRRSDFKEALLGQEDVAEFVFSGSLERRTQRNPMNDVDVVVIYDSAVHPDWGVDGDGSAEGALEHARSQVKDLLSTDSSGAEYVRLTRLQNHAVKCFLDDPDDENAFTVDVMPALRLPDKTLLVPEKHTDRWINTNPEFLIAKVADRQAEWPLFVPTVRIVKHWSEHAGTDMKSLVSEVLALNLMPSASTQAEALYAFFQAASIHVLSAVDDPAGLCGEIQPDLDRDHAHDLLDKAASGAWKAINAEEAGQHDEAMCHWNSVFGDSFPQPAGGCEKAAKDYSGIGVGIGAGAQIHEKPRPIRDTPQG